MNKDVFAEVLVGLFMTAILALLAYFTIIISGVDLIAGHAKCEVRIAFTDVGGLKERDNVVYRGMKVGTVDRIDLDKTGITVVVRIDNDVVLRDTYRISVTPLSLLGGNCLTLEEGRGHDLPLGTTLFQGQPPMDWMRDLGEIARKLNDLTSDGSVKSIVTNLQSVSEKANAIAIRVERGEGTVGRLLSTNDTLYVDTAATVASARTIATRLERGEGTVGKLLSSDEQVYSDLKRTLAHAAEISDRLVSGEGAVGKLLSTNDVVYTDLRQSLANVRALTDRIAAGEGLLGRVTVDKQMGINADRLVANLSQVSDNLAVGKGTIGKLVAEQELYDEVNGLLKDIRQIVDNYRDTTPISTFGSLIMGGL